MIITVHCNYTFQRAICAKVLDSLYPLSRRFRFVSCILFFIIVLRFFSYLLSFFSAILFSAIFFSINLAIQLDTSPSLFLLFSFIYFSFLHISVSFLFPRFVQNMSISSTSVSSGPDANVIPHPIVAFDDEFHAPVALLASKVGVAQSMCSHWTSASIATRRCEWASSKLWIDHFRWEIYRASVSEVWLRRCVLLH